MDQLCEQGNSIGNFPVIKHCLIKEAHPQAAEMKEKIAERNLPEAENDGAR